MHVLAGLQLSGHADVVLGEGVFVNVDCFIDAQAAVTIGDHVSLGDHVRLITSTHQDGSSRKRAGALMGRPVSIGSGTWIGSGTTVLPGVNVGAGCVIAAGSMVTEDCERDSLYAGVPARLKRRLTLNWCRLPADGTARGGACGRPVTRILLKVFRGRWR
ncbi:acyltransferase [Clavibacter capsici]|uniref:acyltransferase n=1 Tax=Clavibacter capsici TaxID=1874630 RepID=UPI0014280782|nr:acyltransferase [Clavibacter capsici]QIS42036.1 acyltransferase [Clavibacter capsici]